MDVVTTSLEALIQRATNPQNQRLDVAAIEAFCVMLTKECEGVQIASKLLASRVQSTDEWEAMQTLAVLDTCMKRCGPSFHAEVGKFRFLNELIKLVSPKYLGNKTAPAVRRKVLELLFAWTKEYPRESKIKEAYEMLKKQGVVKEDMPFFANNATGDLLASKLPKTKNPIFEDEEKSKLLQKLLQSKNPDDLQAANRLIKTMVKEDEKRVQQDSRRTMELESVHNNVKLLSEMLDSYDRNESSVEDLELMKELFQACERLKPVVLRLANETQDNEEMLEDVLIANDELGRVFEKYATVVVLGRPRDTSRTSAKNAEGNGLSLLDLSSPNESPVSTGATEQVRDTRTDFEVLGDIFGSLNDGSATQQSSSKSSDVPALLLPDSIMQPVSVSPVNKKKSESSAPAKIDSKAKALEELNELGESLLKQSLSSAKGRVSDVSRSEPIENTKRQNSREAESAVDRELASSLNGDDSLVDLSFEPTEDLARDNDKTVKDKVAETVETEIKPLTDINVSLENIQPGTIGPLTVIEEKNGISVVLHFARDSPRPDVSVIVITTMSKNTKSLGNYLFQAVVPKRCKCRLQAPSGTTLPAHNPFLPPSAITQIMLIANPHKEPVSLKFMLSYTMDDETVTEMGEVDELFPSRDK